jgi:hypothetical protein
MRKTLALALTFCLSGWPVLAQDVPAADVPTGPITRTLRLEMAKLDDARVEAAQGAYRPNGMSPAYFWTAIGLWSAGGINLLSALVLDDDDRICDDLDLDCGEFSTALVVAGAGMIAAGAIVWHIGKRKAASASPSIVASPGRVAIRGTVSF